MEENVALDSTKQKQFVKSIKGIKKLIKKNDNKGVENKIKRAKSKDGKISKREPRGLVYLGHIPHGFYEHEMTQYFKQFGMVTNARVIRSKRSGNSKGFAFVEFKDPAVAEIVAETMNNYLMGKRLIKAAYIPPEKQRHNVGRMKWNTLHNPTREIRLKIKKEHNAPKNDIEDLKKARKLLANFRKNKKKLSNLGINYDFFTPVDIPEGLSFKSKPKVKKEKPDIKSDSENESDKPNKNAKESDKPNKNAKKNKVKIEQVKDKADNAKNGTKKVDIENNEKKEKPRLSEKIKKQNKTVYSKEQNLKEQKLKDVGVKHVENFIKVKEDKDSGESDSSYEFDSDEFEKLLQSDSEVSTGEESDNNEGDEVETNDEESEEEIVTQQKKTTQKPVHLIKPFKELNKQPSFVVPQKKKTKQKPVHLIKPLKEVNKQPSFVVPQKKKTKQKTVHLINPLKEVNKQPSLIVPQTKKTTQKPVQLNKPQKEVNQQPILIVPQKKKTTQNPLQLNNPLKEVNKQSSLIVPYKKKTTQKNVQLIKPPKEVNKEKSPQQIKRKADQKPATNTPKKSKFENRTTEKLVKKEFKKKK